MSLHLNDPHIHKLVRMIMQDGKKHAALRIVDTAFKHLRQKHDIADPRIFTLRAMENAKPVVETRKYKAGGRSLQVPIPCREQRQESLATRFIRYVSTLMIALGFGSDLFLWFLLFDRDAFRQRKELGSGIRLAEELVDLEAKKGKAFQMREEVHRLAERNRTYAHYVR